MSTKTQILTVTTIRGTKLHCGMNVRASTTTTLSNHPESQAEMLVGVGSWVPPSLMSSPSTTRKAGAEPQTMIESCPYHYPLLMRGLFPSWNGSSSPTSIDDQSSELAWLSRDPAHQPSLLALGSAVGECSLSRRGCMCSWPLDLQSSPSSASPEDRNSDPLWAELTAELEGRPPMTPTSECGGAERCEDGCFCFESVMRSWRDENTVKL